MSRMLNAFLVGGIVGYYLGTRPRDQVVDDLQGAASNVWGFTLDKIHDLKDARDDAPWHEPRPDPLLEGMGIVDISAGSFLEDDDETDADPFPSSDPPPTWGASDRSRSHLG